MTTDTGIRVTLSDAGLALAYATDQRIRRIAARHQILIAAAAGVVAGIALHYLGM